jgi:lipoprotein NlpD
LLRSLLLATALGSTGCSWHRGSVRTAAGEPRGLWHAVRSGDTLAGLATRYRVPAEDIAEINGVADDRILAGVELFIPGPRGSPGSAAAAARAPATAPGPTARLRWPVQGALSSGFGRRWGRRHEGIDIAASEGTAIRAAADGRVIFSGAMRGYGNVIIVEHADRLVTVYAHNQRNLVDEGTRVRTGDELARVGQTGRATGPHLHFEVRRGVLPLDPTRYLEAR